MSQPQPFRSHDEDPLQRLDLYRALFEESPLAILVMDDQGRFIEVNPAACRLLDAPRDRLVGRSIEEFVGSDAHAFDDRWRAFRADESQRGEFVLKRPDGEQRTVRFSAVADFAPGMHVSFLEDSSEEREATAACRPGALLQAGEECLRALADSLGIMIWAEDSDGRVQYANRHWLEYSGRPQGPPDSPGLQDWASAVHPDDLRSLEAFLSNARASGKTFRVTLRLRRHDGAYRAHSCLTVPTFDESGRVTRRLGSATDIQDQLDALEALKNERDLRERFVASLSHDLRSPLTAAKMGAQLLARSADRPDRLQLQTNRVIRNIDRADQLIQNLLDVTRISAGEPLVLERAECDVAATARDVLDDHATIHSDRFVLDAPASVPAVCDSSALRRILENLIGNGVKYGDPERKVTVKITDAAGEIRLSVHNDGEPIPDADLATIFQPYQRGSRPQRGLGWGLGLTLVHGIAEAHGGTVRVESTRERGTTFTVTLPNRGTPSV